MLSSPHQSSFSLTTTNSVFAFLLVTCSISSTITLTVSHSLGNRNDNEALVDSTDRTLCENCSFSLLLSLYRLPQSDNSINYELSYKNRINRSLSCFDFVLRSSSSSMMSSGFHYYDDDTDEQAINILVESSKTDESPVLTILNNDNDSVKVPRNITFEDENFSAEERAYYVRYVLSMLRLLANVPIDQMRDRSVFYSDSVDDVDDADDQRRITSGVHYANVKLMFFSPLSTQFNDRTIKNTTLVLTQVPPRCRRALSDLDCSVVSDRSLSSASSTEFRNAADEAHDCIDIFLFNAVLIHSYFNLPNVRVNVTDLGNDCMRRLLLLPRYDASNSNDDDSLSSGYRRRTVKCFHGDKDVQDYAYRYRDTVIDSFLSRDSSLKYGDNYGANDSTTVTTTGDNGVSNSSDMVQQSTWLYGDHMQNRAVNERHGA